VCVCVCRSNVIALCLMSAVPRSDVLSLLSWSNKALARARANGRLRQDVVGDGDGSTVLFRPPAAAARPRPKTAASGRPTRPSEPDDPLKPLARRAGRRAAVSLERAFRESSGERDPSRQAVAVAKMSTDRVNLTVQSTLVNEVAVSELVRSMHAAAGVGLEPPTDEDEDEAQARRHAQKLAQEHAWERATRGGPAALPVAFEREYEVGRGVGPGLGFVSRWGVVNGPVHPNATPAQVRVRENEELRRRAGWRVSFHRADDVAAVSRSTEAPPGEDTGHTAEARDAERLSEAMHALGLHRAVRDAPGSVVTRDQSESHQQPTYTPLSTVRQSAVSTSTSQSRRKHFRFDDTSSTPITSPSSRPPPHLPASTPSRPPHLPASTPSRPPHLPASTSGTPSFQRPPSAPGVPTPRTQRLAFDDNVPVSHSGLSHWRAFAGVAQPSTDSKQEADVDALAVGVAPDDDDDDDDDRGPDTVRSTRLRPHTRTRSVKWRNLLLETPAEQRLGPIHSEAPDRTTADQSVVEGLSSSAQQGIARLSSARQSFQATRNRAHQWLETSGVVWANSRGPRREARLRSLDAAMGPVVHLDAELSRSLAFLGRLQAIDHTLDVVQRMVEAVIRDKEELCAQERVLLAMLRQVVATGVFFTPSNGWPFLSELRSQMEADLQVRAEELSFPLASWPEMLAAPLEIFAEAVTIDGAVLKEQLEGWSSGLRRRRKQSQTDD
jgi:hypothetical protein